MMLATAAAGRRATAIHAAIGAGPGAAPRRLIIEGGLIGVVASILAVVLYAWVRTKISDIALLPTLSLRLDLAVPGDMMRWLLPTGVIAGVLMAAGPALWVARQPAWAALQAGGSRIASDRGVAHARRLLVSAQVAMCLVLIVGATLFGRSLERLATADLGIVREGLLALDFDIEPTVTRGQTPDAVAHEALRRTRAAAGRRGRGDGQPRSRRHLHAPHARLRTRRRRERRAGGDLQHGHVRLFRNGGHSAPLRAPLR